MSESFGGADGGLDHHLLVFRMKLKSKRASVQSVNQRKAPNTALLKDKTKRERVQNHIEQQVPDIVNLIEDETV